MNFDLRRYNRDAWDHQVTTGNKWTVPVGPDDIAAARKGYWNIVLTPVLPAPRDWFPATEDGSLAGVRVLGLAAAGGQQGPILAAAGADVTVFDNSPAQLEQDRLVADREGLDITLVEGDMRDLSALDDASFDLIVHPCSNVFVPEVRPVWNECARVLRPGGVLLAGMINPAYFLFSADEEDGRLYVRYALPYSDLESAEKERLQGWLDHKEPLCFSHTLTDQLGGQTEAGLAITGMYEDRYPDETKDALSARMATFIATRSIKLATGP